VHFLFKTNQCPLLEQITDTRCLTQIHSIHTDLVHNSIYILSPESTPSKERNTQIFVRCRLLDQPHYLVFHTQHHLGVKVATYLYVNQCSRRAGWRLTIEFSLNSVEHRQRALVDIFLGSTCFSRRFWRIRHQLLITQSVMPTHRQR
jgi:hypothetical protein